MMEFEQHPTEPNTLVIKMRKRYIAKHSDEDLQAAVLAEREACAEHYLAIMRDAVAQAVKREREACAKLCEEFQFDYAAAIRGRTE